MRVISGKWKGKRLISKEGLSTRPTLDRVKETVFNVLMPYIYDCNFLDMFAGSGAMGIEALSRGAGQAVFIEQDKKSIDIINKNLSNAGASKENAVIMQSDALVAAHALSKLGQSFHIVFMDPPYDYPHIEQLFANFIKYESVLHDAAVLVLEHVKNREINVPEVFTLIKQKKASKTCVSFYGYNSKS